MQQEVPLQVQMCKFQQYRTETAILIQAVTLVLVQVLLLVSLKFLEIILIYLLADRIRSRTYGPVLETNSGSMVLPNTVYLANSNAYDT